MLHSKNRLELKDKVSVLMKLADYDWRNFDGRRAQQWKTNLTLWTALAALAGFASWKEINIQPWLAACIYVFLGLVFLVYWLPWTTGMWRRNFDDAKNARMTLSRVRTLLNEPIARKNVIQSRFPPKGNWKDYGRVWLDWSRFAELLFTVLFLLIAGLAVYSRIPATQSSSTQTQSKSQNLTQARSSSQKMPAIITPGPANTHAPAQPPTSTK
jgi:uncharacterized membrane protein